MSWLDAAVEEAKKVPQGMVEGRSYLRDVCAAAVRGAFQSWADAYEESQILDMGDGKRAMMSFGEDGYRALVFVVDVPEPPDGVEAWRQRVRLSLDVDGSYGYGLEEVVVL